MTIEQLQKGTELAQKIANLERRYFNPETSFIAKLMNISAQSQSSNGDFKDQSIAIIEKMTIHLNSELDFHFKELHESLKKELAEL